MSLDPLRQLGEDHRDRLPQPAGLAMNRPDAIASQPLPSLPTTAYRLATPSLSLREGVSRPSLLTPPAGPQSVSALQLLLRSRLRVVALILLGLQAGSLWLYLGDLIRAGSTGSIVFNVGLFGAFVAYVALLWKTRPLALRELRTLEGVLFGLLM